MGSFLRLAKALNKPTKSSINTNLVESDEDKKYQKFLETLTDEELENLIRDKLAAFNESEEGKVFNSRLSKMTEVELAIELLEKLKVR